MNSYEQRSNMNRPGKGIKDRNVHFYESNKDYDPYDLLCVAVIRQAAKDTINKSSEAYRFWTSELYDFYTTNLPELENMGVKIRDHLVSIGGLRMRGEDEY